MKNTLLLISILFIVLSCKNETNKKLDKTNSEELKKNDEELNKVNYFKLYENILKQEYIENPDSTIAKYYDLIEKTSDSVLRKKIYDRILIIGKDKKYWNINDGWKIDKDGILKKPKKGLNKIECE